MSLQERGGASAVPGLTWVGGNRSIDDLDDASRKNLAAASSGTSIFDPVLCELVYRWFSPVGGSVLDPFAGGSVRGIVAAKLGRHYTGIDLRAEQIDANRIQWNDISRRSDRVAESGMVRVKISAAMARLPFNGCDPEYIRTTCHASCCDSSTAPSGIVVTIHPSEQAAIEARGGVVKDGLLQPSTGKRKCPFKDGKDLCGLHFTPDKPFGCIASPFTLTSANTLIVRNRYKLLKCYDDGKKIPAYKAFRASLNLIFGLEEASKIVAHLDAGGGDMVASMPLGNYRKLVDNDQIKKGKDIGTGEDQSAVQDVDPQWIIGDSTQIRSLVPDGSRYDLLFSCPPYADLEEYSDDPRDISTMGYPEFLTAYRKIIEEACALLRPDRFAVFVVGEVRDSKSKSGSYLGFVPDTIQAFRDAGLQYYNEAILVTAIGSLPIRAGKQFASGRKIGKTHQNVLMFLKGDLKKAIEYCGDVEISLPDDMQSSAVRDE